MTGLGLCFDLFRSASASSGRKVQILTGIAGTGAVAKTGRYHCFYVDRPRVQLL